MAIDRSLAYHFVALSLTCCPQRSGVAVDTLLIKRFVWRKTEFDWRTLKTFFYPTVHISYEDL